MAKNKKPRKPYKQKYWKSPSSAAIHYACPDMVIAYRAAVDALQFGYCIDENYDNLADCCYLLGKGAATVGDTGCAAVADVATEKLVEISKRFDRTGKWGMTGEEREVLITMIDIYEDFWNRQSGQLFAQVSLELDARLKAIAEGKKELNVTTV